VGQRSYGIYIWHWVVFQVTRPSVDLTGETWALYLARVLLVLALADISLRWVEIPFRQGNIQNWVRGVKYRAPRVQLRHKAYILLSILSLVAVSASISAQAISKSELAAEQLLNESMINEDEDLAASTGDLGSTTGVWVTGDSVILGVRAKLERQVHISLINARVGRQAPELLAAMGVDQISVPESPIVFNLGNNNKLSLETVTEIFETVKNQPQIVVVNTAVPRSWRDENNKIIATVAANYPNVKLVDWNKISEGKPQLFAPDGVHLSPLGSDAYVAAILDVLIVPAK
jgi:hypothetical protein